MSYHDPVLLEECLEGLNINPKGLYVDVTFGGRGHSKAILEQLTTGKLYAFDQDPDAKANLPEHPVCAYGCFCSCIHSSKVRLQIRGFPKVFTSLLR